MLCKFNACGIGQFLSTDFFIIYFVVYYNERNKISCKYERIVNNGYNIKCIIISVK